MQPSENRLHYYGWRVAIAAHVCVALGFALYAYTFGVFVGPLAAEFGWSRGNISTGFAITALAVAIFSPFVGKWIDRRGPRVTLLSSVSIFGAGFLGFSQLTSHLWHLYSMCFAIGAVGNAIQMGYTRAISTWFDHRRGLALGTMLAGEGIGTIVFPLMTQRIVLWWGWRTAYALMGSAILLISLPLTILYARIRVVPNEKLENVPNQMPALLQNLRVAAFWIILAVLFLASIGVNGAITQQIPMLTDRGLPVALAAVTVSALGFSSLTGRFLNGWLLDHFSGPAIAFAFLSIAAGGIALLAEARTFPSAVAAAALLGFGGAGTSSVTPYLLARYFGADRFSTLYGLTWTVYAIAGGAGPMLLGYAYDSTHSYASVLLLLGCGTALGALLTLFLPATQPRDNANPNIESEVVSTES
ncbi:MAG TPA: MFS transporter [Bryobacteraceae bacterium]|jgi:MFS family permease